MKVRIVTKAKEQRYGRTYEYSETVKQFKPTNVRKSSPVRANNHLGLRKALHLLVEGLQGTGAEQYVNDWCRTLQKWPDYETDRVTGCPQRAVWSRKEVKGKKERQTHPISSVNNNRHQLRSGVDDGR